MRTITNIPINLDVLNEFSEIHHSTDTQETLGRSSVPTTQVSTLSPITQGNGSEPLQTEPGSTHSRASAPEQPSVTRESEPALVSNERSLNLGTGAGHATLSNENRTMEGITAPSSESRRVVLPPPIPGFIAGAADAGMCLVLPPPLLSHHIIDGAVHQNFHLHPESGKQGQCPNQ